MSKENGTTAIKSLSVNFHDWSSKIHKVLVNFSIENEAGGLERSDERPLRIQFFEDGEWLHNSRQLNVKQMPPVLAYEVSSDIADLEHLIKCLTEACEMWRETWGKKPDDVT
jgi:hypothetical protein